MNVSVCLKLLSEAALHPDADAEIKTPRPSDLPVWTPSRLLPVCVCVHVCVPFVSAGEISGSLEAWALISLPDVVLRGRGSQQPNQPWKFPSGFLPFVSCCQTEVRS